MNDFERKCRVCGQNPGDGLYRVRELYCLHCNSCTYCGGTELSGHDPLCKVWIWRELAHDTDWFGEVDMLEDMLARPAREVDGR